MRQDTRRLAVASTRVASGLQTFRDRRPFPDAFLDYLSAQGCDWALVGGAPRGWVLGSGRPPKDLDIVVKSTASEVKAMMLGYERDLATEVACLERTSFGGLRFHLAGDVLDLWAAQATVGVVEGRVEGHDPFDLVARSAGLSLDSIVWTSSGRIYEKGFFETMDTGIITLNNCHLVRRPRLAEKAMELSAEFGFIPDLAVQQLIAEELGEGKLEDLWSLLGSPRAADGRHKDVASEQPCLSRLIATRLD